MKKKKVENIFKKVLTFLKFHVIIKKKEREEKEMTVSRKVEREMLRTKYLDMLVELLVYNNEDVQRVKSNEIAIPVVGCEDNEDWIVITVKVPTGANKGTEPYDGYAMAEEYSMKRKEKELKAKEKEEKKKRKIARDEEIRKKKKEIAEKGEQ